MSYSIGSQGRQSCLELSQITTPLILSLVSSSNIACCSCFLSSCSSSQKTFMDSNTNEMGCWTFLQSLSIHPQPKLDLNFIRPSSDLSSSSYFMSDRSLELCTESLGSETGSDLIGGWGGEELPALFASQMVEHGAITNDDNFPTETIASTLVPTRRKYSRSTSFPPPLTSIRDSSAMKVKPYREDGRLILKAVSIASTEGYLQVERQNGRTTLQFTRDCDYGDAKLEEREEEEDVENRTEEEHEEEDGYQIESDQFEDPEDLAIGDGMMMMGVIARRRPISRCKENGKDLINWSEPFWVAT